MNFLSDNGGESYNLCHCTSLRPSSSLSYLHCLRGASVWSNFEIGDLDFWRGPVYSAFFEYLEARGGFYYEVRLVSPFFFSMFLSLTVWPDSGGAMRQCTRSPRRYSQERTRSTSSARSGTSTPRSRIVPPRRTCGAVDVVRATLQPALVRVLSFLALCLG